MPEHELLGTRIGHIRVVALLGQGGMGSIYIGYDERLCGNRFGGHCRSGPETPG